MNTKEKLYLEAKERYYFGHPIMTDYEFDELEKELKEEGSNVINIIGASVPKRFKRKHLTEQKSLDKIQINKESDKIQVNSWVAKFPSNFYFCEPKYDGNSATVYYKNSKLDYVLSRGDGIEGSDITSKIKHDLPSKLSKFYSGTIIIKGEICIETKLFNNKYLPLGFKNPRNFVAGKLNPENDEVCEDIKFIPYEITTIQNDKKIHFEDSEVLSLGFKTLPKILKIEKMHFDSLYKGMKNYRENECEFQLDGFVIKTDIAFREIYGEKSHHPNWAIAIKFPPEEKRTKIIGIDWSIGKTGELTPIAILEPIILDGSEISRASLHNFGYILEKEVYIGTEVIIAKKGDIIPQIIKSYKSVKLNFDLYRKSPELLFPKHIPFNELKLDGVHLYWENERLIEIRKIQSAIKLLKIDDLGDSTIEKLYDEGLKNITQIFCPTFKDLLKRIFTNEDSSMPDKIYQNLINIKEIEYWKVINLLQEINLGSALSKKLAEHYSGIKTDFKGLNKELVLIYTDNNSVQYKALKTLESVILKNGFKIKYPQMTNNNLITFEMTGSWDGGTKELFVEKTKTFAKHTSLNKDTNYLVCEDINGNSSKIIKAKKNNITCITYDDFLKL